MGRRPSRHLSHRPKNVGEEWLLICMMLKRCIKRAKRLFTHSGREIVQHAALTE